MKNNQPVTQKECLIPDHAAIISRTDAKGIITYVNDDFVRLSGFTRADVIGQPHNILRHPDMPPEVFRDFWETLQAGRPWLGLMKNRCRNGDHYWVKATATPTPDGGYMSLRVKPSRDEVKAAEALFARMRQDPGMRMRGGQLRKGGLAALMEFFMDMGLATKLWITTLASMVAVLAAVFMGWAALGSVLGELKPEAAANVAPFRTGLLALAGVTLVAWPTVAWWVIRNLNRPLQQAVEAAKGIAAFDFSKPVPMAGMDEVGQLLQQFAIMRNNLQEGAVLIQQNARLLDAAVGVLKDSSGTAAHAATEQSEASSSMAASVEQLSVSIDQMEEHAQEASNVASQAGEASRAGSRVVHHTADEISRVADAVNTSAATIRELEGFSSDISAIVEVIREIAEQTNLLALNAAIEAARAGEQGRGFAVVADEVRKLAERTSNSTQQISGMIEKVQHGAQRAVAVMENGVTQVAEGVQLAHKAGDSIAAIESTSGQVVHTVAEISSALREQAMAAKQIAQNVERVAQMTERGSRSSQETAQVAREVAGLSAELRRLADMFKI